MSITINVKGGNIDKDIIIPIEWEDVTVKYWGELATIIKKHYMLSSEEDETEEYKPVGKRSFDFEGETYYFPSEFFKKETYGDFIESTQLNMYINDMENGRFDVLPEQMAILCRRIDEKYDDDAIAEKADKFRELTMDIIWEFSFFLTQQTVRLSKLSPTYLGKKQQAQGQE